MKMETINDIVNKMLEAAKKSPIVNSLDLVFFATHITAAYHESAQYQAKLLEEYRAENARLKAALKPVMDVHITQDDESLEIYDSTMDGVLSVRAVHEAQRIYNEGAK